MYAPVLIHFNTIGLNYGFGLVYSYDISNKFSLLANLGLSFSSFTPKHAEIVDKLCRVTPLSVYEREIDYVKEIESGNPSEDQPEQRIEQSIKTNTAYFGFGIKYNI